MRKNNINRSQYKKQKSLFVLILRAIFCRKKDDKGSNYPLR
ncbi:MAG: hypothetical protein ACK5WP_09340 [Neisseriaceae bacterium]